jgi:FkbM family methyltransferase
MQPGKVPELAELVQSIQNLTIDEIRAIAEDLAIIQPLQTYPGWHFNIDWDNQDDNLQLRRTIWEFCKTNQLETQIKSPWYNNLKLHLNLGNDLSSQLFVSGCYEPNEFFFLNQILLPGMTFIDAGANDGIYSLFAAQAVGPEGLVIAIEPSQREFGNLQNNIKLNAIANIKPLQLALSNFDGSAALKLANYEHAGQNTLGDFIYEGVGSPEVETTSVRQLDNLLKEMGIQSVDVIKMDVEGAEFSVLQGAQSILKNCHPLLLLELSDQALQNQGSSAAAVLKFLRQMGYEIFTLGHSGLFLKATHDLSLSSNIVAAHPERSWKGLMESDQMRYRQIEFEHIGAKLEEVRFQFNQTLNNLKETQLNLHNTQAQLTQSQIELQQTRLELNQMQPRLEQAVAEQNRLREELQQNQTVLQDYRVNLEQAIATINGMTSSKFWKLRNAWFRLKNTVGL